MAVLTMQDSKIVGRSFINHFPTGFRSWPVPSRPCARRSCRMTNGVRALMPGGVWRVGEGVRRPSHVWPSRMLCRLARLGQSRGYFFAPSLCCAAVPSQANLN